MQLMHNIINFLIIPFNLTKMKLQFPDSLDLAHVLPRLATKFFKKLTDLKSDEHIAGFLCTLTKEIIDLFCECINLLNEETPEAFSRYLFQSMKEDKNVFKAFGRFTEHSMVVDFDLATIMADLFRLFLVKMTKEFKLT
jgi:hypothetical protein